MKKQLQIAALLSVMGSGMLVATTSEFRSPLRVIRGVMHAPFQPVEEAWWTDQTPECDDPPCWQINSWGAGYYRAANQAFFNPCGGSTTKTTSLSTLFFGAEEFAGEQIFVNGTISGAQLTASTPFLGFAAISPRFKYTERGVVAGIDAMRTFGCDDCWHAGARAGLPVKEIEVEPVNVGAIEETLQNVVAFRPLCQGTGANLSQVDFAYRLDFLTSLSRCVVNSAGTPSIQSIVQYDNGMGATNQDFATQITGVLASGTSASGPDVDEQGDPNVYVTRVAPGGAGTGSCLFTNAPTGQLPMAPYCKPASAVSGALNADGSGGNIGQTLFFEFGENYAAGLGVDTSAQSGLFVVGRCESETLEGGVPSLVQGAVIIYQNVQALLPFFEQSETALAFFQANGIDFTRYDRNVGVGDLDVEAYVGYGHLDNWYIDGILGARFPTGTRPKNATNIYFQPTGNKKHYEIKFALEGGIEPVGWFGFHTYLAYSHAFKAEECRAAPFKQMTSPCNTECCEASCDTDDDCDDDNCCTPDTNQFACVDCSTLFVKNVGPNLCVDVSWDYFVGNFDFTFFHPCNPELGASVGYEIMYKGKDHVTGDNCDCTTAGIPTATDLLGNTNQPLDLSILEVNTKTITHKLYAELFHRWNYCELFIGASHIVAGENAMKESEAHLGMKFFF